MSACPCCSGKAYKECCKPYHEGALPATPVALMRSRYSAYALQKSGYIMATTHPDSPYFEKDAKTWERALIKFSKETQFLKLEIIAAGEDWVQFVAHLRQNGVAFTLKEKSHFAKVGGKWLYRRAEIEA